MEVAAPLLFFAPVDWDSRPHEAVHAVGVPTPFDDTCLYVGYRYFSRCDTNATSLPSHHRRQRPAMSHSIRRPNRLPSVRPVHPLDGRDPQRIFAGLPVSPPIPPPMTRPSGASAP
jgi:hypothetical protein